MTKDLFPSPPPLTPPHHEEEWLNWLRLLRSRRVGPSTFYRLLDEHGTAAAALIALPEIARAAGVKDYRVCPENIAQNEIQAGKLAGARLAAIGCDTYPNLLAKIKDAPPLVWTLGNIMRRPTVAIVGARNASSAGTRLARKIAADLGEAGYIVVSGLARGIDAAAHFGAAPYGTLAVMAGGVDVIYPAENAVLAQEILDRGMRISEQPMGLQPKSRHFPQRNRLVSGLCQGVLVVEAAMRSGSLITARTALDQGRDVLAVPGHPMDGRASGCNALIRDGAVLVRSADDVISVLGETITDLQPAVTPTEETCVSGPDLREQTDLHNQILSRLSACPVPEDQLIRDLNISAGKIAPALVALELDGKVNRAAGGLLNLVL